MVLFRALALCCAPAWAQGPAFQTPEPNPELPAATTEMPETDAKSQVIVFHVAAKKLATYERFELELERLGETETLYLSDEGQIGDTPGDNVFVAVSTGEYSRTVGVKMYAWLTNGGRVLIYASIVRTNDPTYSVLSWQVGERADGRAERIATDWPADAAADADELRVFVLLGWLAVTLAYAGFVAGRSRA